MEAPMEHPIVAEAVKNDEEALVFLRMIARVLHFFDDLADKDSPITDADINIVLQLSLVSLPRNAFYREHFDDLNPLLMQAIINWRVATNIERNSSDRGDLIFAFVIRSTYVDLAVMAATLIGGIEHGVKYGLEIRRWAHGEGFDGYVTNLAAEKTAREAATHETTA